jgi:hypothetical protein
MSTLCSLRKPMGSIHPFIFRNATAPPVDGEADEALYADSAADPAVEIKKIEEEAYRRGLREGSLRERAEHEKALMRERDRLNGGLREFTAQREQYFHTVENEVVKLTLAIARKILHREVKIDPLVLAGVVRHGAAAAGASVTVHHVEGVFCAASY